jgi:hypothetical protein
MDYSEMFMKKHLKNLSWLIFLVILVSGCEDFPIFPTGDDAREKVSGLWLCDESDGYLKSALETYYVEIDPHPYDSTKVLISNFFNVDDDAEAGISGTSLTLASQILEGGFTVHGSGVVSKNYTQIDWVYFVDDGSGTEYKVTAVYTKESN